MHFKGSYLDFKRLPVGTDQSRMKRLVHIRLRHCDVILESSRDRLIHLMDHTQRRIAVLYCVHQDADGKKIIDLVDGLVLVHHFFVNAEEVLDPSGNLGFDPGVVHMLLHLFYDAVDKLLPLALSQRDLIYQIIINIRF